MDRLQSISSDLMKRTFYSRTTAIINTIQVIFKTSSRSTPLIRLRIRRWFTRPTKLTSPTMRFSLQDKSKTLSQEFPIKLSGTRTKPSLSPRSLIRIFRSNFRDSLPKMSRPRTTPTKETSFQSLQWTSREEESRSEGTDLAISQTT